MTGQVCGAVAAGKLHRISKAHGHAVGYENRRSAIERHALLREVIGVERPICELLTDLDKIKGFLRTQKSHHASGPELAGAYTQIARVIGLRRALVARQIHVPARDHCRKAECASSERIPVTCLLRRLIRVWLSQRAPFPFTRRIVFHPCPSCIAGAKRPGATLSHKHAAGGAPAERPRPPYWTLTRSTTNKPPGL